MVYSNISFDSDLYYYSKVQKDFIKGVNIIDTRSSKTAIQVDVYSDYPHSPYKANWLNFYLENDYDTVNKGTVIRKTEKINISSSSFYSGDYITALNMEGKDDYYHREIVEQS